MISTTPSVASLLSQIYQSTTNSMNNSMSAISTGKRVQNASDDPAAYFQAAANNGYITQYTAYSQDLQNAKGYADLGVATGNAVLADLSKLLDITNQYAGTSDANTQAALNVQYEATLTSMNQTIAGSFYNNIQVYTKATLYNSQTTIDGQVMNISVAATDIGANAGLANAKDGAATVQGVINGAENYVAQMGAAQDAITTQINLNSTITGSLTATNSILTDVNEAQEQLNVTNDQVRLQATASMMAQANSSAAVIAKLFQ